MIEPFSSSDHNGIKTDINLNSTRINHKTRKIYLYSKGDYEGLNEETSKQDWSTLLSNTDIEDNWSIFKDQYARLVDKYVPSKFITPGRRHKPTWCRYKSVRRAKKKRRKLWVQYQRTKLESDRLLYEEQRKDTDSTIKKAKENYEEKLVNSLKEDPKRFWNYSRHFTRSSSTIEVLEDQGNKITDDNDKANLLNDFFTSILTDEPNLDTEDDTLQGPNPATHTLDHIVFLPSDIRTKLLNLKPNKASGPDSVNINILRQCPNLDVPLTKLFQQSHDTGQIPQDWKDAHVVPLYKKGSRLSCNNYRPVSLTSQVAKLMERCILQHMSKTLKANNFIHPCQHGFQVGCSCVTQLLESMEDWTAKLDEGESTDVIYMDFSKAFDRVPHKRLLLKVSRTSWHPGQHSQMDTQLSDR